MNRQDLQVKQTIEQIGGMQRALESLAMEVLPKNRLQFALMAEGPLDMIRRLGAEVEEYISKVEAGLDSPGADAESVLTA